MKRLLLLLLLIPALAAAKVPDEDNIIDRTMDSESPYYYPALMLRYNAGDATLTDEDYHYLYYGYAYQDDYKPLATNPDLDKMLMLASGIDPDKPDVATLESMVSMGTDALKRDPFSPKILNLMSFAYGGLGDEVRKSLFEPHERRDPHDPRLGRRIHAENPAPRADVRPRARRAGRRRAFVRQGAHRQPHGGVRAADGSLCRRGKKRKGFYFDFGRVYWNKPEGYTYKRDRTWQFNNLKPRTYK